MSLEGKTLKLCNCNKTIELDAKALAKALKADQPLTIHRQLCRRESGAYRQALNDPDVLVACTQEAPLFSELAQAANSTTRLRFANIREAAGWSAEGNLSTPKIAALLAAATLPEAEPVPSVEYKSEGELLVIGPSGAALDWAARLADGHFGQLGVSVLITRSDGGELPISRTYPVTSGRLTRITGYLGAFDVEWIQENPIDLEKCTRCNACIKACPEDAIDFGYQVDLNKCKAHRKCVNACGAVEAIDFERAERARSERFDLVLDLSAEPFLKAHQPPQGYFAPGRDPLEQSLAAAQLTQMVGEFEKPKFFEYRENICAHSRAKIIGCSQCIDVCSTNAISSGENKVSVEPHLCMGCGACASVCPSGAMSYAYPRVADMGMRIRTILETYRNAGGKSPCLLFHNATDGRELVNHLGRRGKGLPANVIPVEVFHVAALGIDLILGSYALGAVQCLILSAGSEAPEYRDSLGRQLNLAGEILEGLGYGKGHFRLLAAQDIAALEKEVWCTPPQLELKPAAFNLFNEKRTTLDFVFDHLAKNAPTPTDEIPLSNGAPYGRVNVDANACTLCMACVGSCPEGALLDAKDKPRLKFIERNCVQCGLCERTCPEGAIALTPRLLLSKDAKLEAVLNEAEPFNCIRCGKPFGTKQLIDGMLGRLNTHSMFRTPDALRRLQMCADCRVIDMMENSAEMDIVNDRGGRDKEERR